MIDIRDEFNKHDLLEAYDIATAMLKEAQSPESIARAKRLKAEHVAVIQDLGDAITKLEVIMAEKFPGYIGQVQFWVPRKIHGRVKGERLVIMEFDGEKLKANFNGQKPLPLKHTSLAVRMGAAETVPLLFNQLRTKYRWQSQLSV